MSISQGKRIAPTIAPGRLALSSKGARNLRVLHCDLRMLPPQCHPRNTQNPCLHQCWDVSSFDIIKVTGAKHALTSLIWATDYCNGGVNMGRWPPTIGCFSASAPDACFPSPSARSICAHLSPPASTWNALDLTGIYISLATMQCRDAKTYLARPKVLSHNHS